MASYPCARAAKSALSSSSSEERSSRKLPYFFTVRRTGASDWSTLISPVASQSGRVLHLLVVVALLGLRKEIPLGASLAEGDPAWGELEDLLDVLARILLAHLVGHHLKKHTALVDM